MPSLLPVPVPARRPGDQRYRIKPEDARGSAARSLMPNCRRTPLLSHCSTSSYAIRSRLSQIAMHDAIALAQAIRRRRLSPVELVDDTLARIARVNPRLNAWLAVFPEAARRAARRAEQLARRRGTTPPPLLGVPVSVKDLILTTEA